MRYMPKSVSVLCRENGGRTWDLVAIVENFESEHAAVIAGEELYQQLHDEFGDGPVIDGRTHRRN